MPIVIHVAGPSGVGKTTLGDKLHKKYGNKIIVKDIDDLRREFVESFYAKIERPSKVFNKVKYQEFLTKYIKSQKKLLAIVGLNNMPWWHPDLYYDLHSDYMIYMDLDDKIIFKQKCSRFIKKVFIDNQQKTIDGFMKKKDDLQNLYEHGMKNECNYEKMVADNLKWKKDYKKQGYKIIPRDDAYKVVSQIIASEL